MTLKLSYPSLVICFACCACMAISCSSDSEDIPGASEGTKVTFDVKDLTRATAAATLEHFSVYGDMKSTKVSNAVPVIIFNKTFVEHSEGNWSYEGSQYWYPDYEYSFVAIYPWSVLETANNPQYTNSKLSFTYTLPLTAEGLVNDKDVADISTATHRRLYDESTPVSPVVLRFSHLLTQINFSLELTEPSTRSEESFKIHKLEMSGFGTSANINIKAAPMLGNPQTNDSEIHILTAKGNGSLRISFAEPIEVTNGAPAIKMFDDGNALILLPQTFGANEEVEVRLTYTINDETEETQISTTLSGFTWESGKGYNYKIKLEMPEAKEANMVISNATITPWDLIDDHDEVDAK